MPSGWDQVIDDFRRDLVGQIAPYQPSIMPMYPNSALTAGTIPPTLITSGHPVQYPITERLENNACQITLFFDKSKERRHSYINDIAPTVLVPGLAIAQQVSYEHSRSVKEIVVQIWAYSRQTRQVMSDTFLLLYGDFYRLTHSDNMISLFRYEHRMDNDSQMLDSVFMTEFIYSVDATMTTTYEVTTVQTTDLALKVNPPI